MILDKFPLGAWLRFLVTLYSLTVVCRSVSAAGVVDSILSTTEGMGDGSPVLTGTSVYMGYSMSSSSTDFDGDGVIDLLVGSIGAAHIFYMNSNKTVKAVDTFTITDLNDAYGVATIDAGLNLGKSIGYAGTEDNGDFLVFFGIDNDKLGTSQSYGGLHYVTLDKDTRQIKDIVQLGRYGPLYVNVGGGDYYGTSVAALGDVDGNNYTDFVVGSKGNHNVNDFGGVYVIRMVAFPIPNPNTGFEEVYIGKNAGGFTFPVEANSLMGASVTALGDLNLDGIPDFATGAWSNNDGGVVVIVFLHQNATVKANTGFYSNETGAPAAYFGFAVAMSDDLNGDGIQDLLVGAAWLDNVGAVYVIFLTRDGGEVGRMKLIAPVGALRFGTGLMSLGDIDGDSVPDFAIGDYGRSGNAGAVYIMSNTSLMYTGPGSQCLNNPCNTGICSVVGDALEYTCDCAGTGSTGAVCQTDIDDCLLSPLCEHNGVCVDTGLPYNYTCDCSNTGFEGSMCEIDINDCLLNPLCENDGVCVDTGLPYNYTCDCSNTGFEGSMCEIDINDCLLNPLCENNGVCVDTGLPYNYTCDCSNTGFEGSMCEIDINDCLLNPLCENNGVCVDTGLPYNYTCDCSNTGFEGLFCEHDINECLAAPCTNGICLDTGLPFNYTCDCTDTGYSGSLCDSPGECISDPCAAGICVEANPFTCDCTGTGMTGYFCDIELVPACFAPDSCDEGYVCLDRDDNVDYTCIPENDVLTLALTLTIESYDTTVYSSSEEYSAALPDLLVQDFGGEPEDYNITILSNKDEPFVVYVVMVTYEQEWDVENVEDMLASSDSVVRSSVVGNFGAVVTDEDADATAADTTENVDLLFLVALLSVCGTLFLAGMVFAAYRCNNQSRKMVYAMPT